MRGNPEAHPLITESSLAGVLSRLAQEPGQWTPIAGGTELMVAHAAGRLTCGKMINLWGLSDLQGIRVDEQFITIGGGATFGQMRCNDVIAREFPLLTRAASWIGSIANQNRATLAGNIVNGSPAADAPPALLVYDAEIELISLNGHRRIPYSEFHTGYKLNVMRPDELVFALHLPRRFDNHAHYLRKVGTRQAMAITKVALAGTAIVTGDCITEVRLAAASLADRPLRLAQTEAVLTGKSITPQTRAVARQSFLGEARPIDDIRSTAAYRSHVGANLLDEFLAQLLRKDSPA